MKLINKTDYRRYIPYAEQVAFCRVFPMSVAEGFQSGSIYESGNCILIRHKNNFSFLIGTPNEAELHEIHELIISENLKFLCKDNYICEAMSALGGVELIPRDIYSYPAGSAPGFSIPGGFTARNIDKELFESITGRVPPSMYWDDHVQFSHYGSGICVMHGSEPASWAFSSAVSSDEMDIGIETSEAYRHTGLAYAAAAAMINKILPLRRPTWTCQRSNLGSAHIAEKLGFIKTAECTMIRKTL